MKNNTLPEKCCANCGFLYGLAKSPYRPEDSIFDPDIMREESYDSEGFPNHLAKIISTIGYYTKSPDTSETPVMTAHTWEYTAKICCYKKKFDPLHPTMEDS